MVSSRGKLVLGVERPPAPRGLAVAMFPIGSLALHSSPRSLGLLPSPFCCVYGVAVSSSYSTEIDVASSLFVG
jgi:hypothetical protein